MIFVLNIFWFGNLIYNRIIYTGDDVTDVKNLGLFLLYFFLLLLLIVLSGFEIRLIDENKRHALRFETMIDYVLRLTTFGVSLLCAYLQLQIKIQIYILFFEFSLLTSYEIFTILIKRNYSSLILDWTKQYLVIETKNNERNKMDLQLKNIFASVFFLGLIVLMFFAVGIFNIPWWIILLLAICLIILIFVYLIQTNNKKPLIWLSGAVSIIILATSYFVSIYYINVSFIFLLLYNIVSIPFASTIFKRN